MKLLNLHAETGQFLYPQQLLKKAFDTYYPEMSMELFCEPLYEEGHPHWAFDNFRCNGAVTDKASFLFYTQPSWGKYFQDRYGMNCKCVTYACDPEIHQVLSSEKEYDIGFIGELKADKGERETEIDLLKSKYKVFVSSDTPTYDLATAYSKCKIIFNPQRSEEINIRFFEGLAMGVQIVRYSSALNLFAQEGKHYLSYKNNDQLIWNINYLLDHPEVRESMSRKARAQALQCHTYKHRAKEMIQALIKVGGI